MIQLTFGQHRLEGKVVTLKSPLAVLDAPTCSGDDGSCGASQEPFGEEKTQRKVQVLAELALFCHPIQSLPDMLGCQSPPGASLIDMPQIIKAVYPPESNITD